jgi:hypothetical protein
MQVQIREKFVASRGTYSSWKWQPQWCAALGQFGYAIFMAAMARVMVGTRGKRARANRCGYVWIRRKIIRFLELTRILMHV